MPVASQFLILKCQPATSITIRETLEIIHLPLQMSQEESTRFYDQLNHHIFELVSSSDANERKGGILAIGKNTHCYD